MIDFLADFLAYYALSCKSKKETSSEYQPNLLKKKLIKNKHYYFIYPETIKLTNSKETMRYLKVKRILRYHFQANVCFHETLLLPSSLNVTMLPS